MKNIHKNIDISMFACILMGLIYIFFPSSNNTLDSLGFANSVRDNEDLFRNHHLLYNPLAYILTQLLGIRNTLSFMCLMNAFFAIGCLFLMRSMLINFTDKKTTGVLIIFLGSCFGFLRFSIDAEAYIVPLFFALWGSRTMLLKQQVFLTSFLVAVACLFHQLYFFWWTGLYFLVFRYFNKNRTRNFLLYASAACIVPLIYLIIFYTTKNDCNNIIEFVFHDYIKCDYVDVSFKPQAIILSFINFFRTFAQVHGYFLPLLKNYFWLCIPVLCALTLFFIGCFHLKNCIEKKQRLKFEKNFASAHWVIFTLQLLFAIFSDGNAEFMYMLPFAGILYLFICFQIRFRTVLYFTSALFLWNLSLAVFPYHFVQLNNNKSMVEYMSRNDKEIYYLQDKAAIHQMTNYYYPNQIFHIYSAEKDINLDSLLSVNKSVITDRVGNKNFLSRANFVHEYDKDLENKYIAKKIDSITYDLGILNVVRLSKK